RNQVHCIAQGGEKMKPVRPYCGVFVVDENFFEEVVDRRTQGGERGDGGPVVVGLHLGRGGGIDGFDRVDQVVFGIEGENFARRRGAGIGLAVLLFFGREDIGGALVAGQQVL